MPHSMRGLVLAGGRGSRLRPLTHTGSKQLLPVANRPILFYVLDTLVDAGVRDLVVLLSPETGDEIRRAVDAAAEWDAGIRYVTQPAPLGLAHAVATARPLLGDDPFCMFLGDNLVGERLGPHVSAFAARPDLAASVLLAEVDDPRQFGVAEVDAHGRVRRLVEKPAVPASNLALVGIYLFRAAIHDAIATLRPSARGELEITDAITALLDAGHEVRFERLRSWWLDTGKKDDLLRANEAVLATRFSPAIHGAVEDSVLEGPVGVAAGARVIRSRIVGPAVIGAGARVVDATIGPFVSVGPGAVVERAEVARSVLYEDARVRDVRLRDSVLGRRADVRGPGGPLTLLLGDDSRVELAPG